MSQITTHILDIARGCPATGVKLALSRDGATIADGTTDADGRVSDLLPADDALPAGDYCITFHTADYFAAHATPTFYPRVQVQFQIAGDGQHYHVPLLLSPFGYSTYRGS